MPNQPIKNIQLKNGSKYPVSPAYRAPIISGNDEYGPTDYPFAYEESPTGAGSLQIVTSVSGTPVDTQTFVLYLISDHEFTQAEFAGMSLEVSQNSLETVASDVMISDADTLISMLMAANGITMSAPFSGLSGDIACFSSGIYVLGVASFNASGITTDTKAGDMSGTPVDVTATVTAPAAGSYWMYTGTATGINGVVSVAEYNLDRRYYNGGIVTINNYLLGMLLGTGTAQSLAPFPSVEKKLITAFAGVPLALCFGFDYKVAIGMSFDGPYTATWSFADGSTLAYHRANHTLTYTAAS